MESEELNELSFCINFKEKETTKFSKKCKIPYFAALFAQILAKMNLP